MRPSLLVLAISLLLLSFCLSGAQGIRFKKGLLFSFGHHKSQNMHEERSVSLMKEGSDIGEVILCKEGQCSSSSSSGTLMKMKRVSRVSRKSKDSKHWLPSIHEDYYGPRHHRPRHHYWILEGMTRKLITATTTSSSSSTTTVNKNEGNKATPTTKGKSSSNGDGDTEGEQGNFPTNSPPSSEQYVDITDITEMDYSPAKRKPPIHN
ncbi:hypothetical protein Patl1_14857 [Pistacia atlantica]|uniref:Uncharacterized protein n=1 Tax=Pistacia atlantica TaxID=434234 RepID=A0ACC1AW80_9ROSI|nr:hypothetical protein Patl1_14857 [Pistacia atlantica]